MVGLTLENPKIVGRFYLGVLALALIFALIASICLGNFSLLLWTLGIIAVGLVACVLLSLIFAIVFTPLLWLLSRLSGRGESEDRQRDKRKESSQRQPEQEP
jgi:membrane protein implicated in regulation of membrane protease activity